MSAPTIASAWLSAFSVSFSAHGSCCCDVESRFSPQPEDGPALGAMRLVLGPALGPALRRLLGSAIGPMLALALRLVLAFGNELEVPTIAVLVAPLVISGRAACCPSELQSISHSSHALATLTSLAAAPAAPALSMLVCVTAI
mmetsp:Transcript_4240/g.7087  ORF Transcript_4240/g.7087 Transcript_4240/m.7087 type:complete len:143 (+) Transcript_4240:935-1363(+)